MALGYFEKMPAAPSVERDTSKTSQGVSNVDVGFIGLGAMGSAIATNLVNKSGHAITVWNRTAAKAESLIAAGAKLARTPKEAGAGKSIVCWRMIPPCTRRFPAMTACWRACLAHPRLPSNFQLCFRELPPREIVNPVDQFLPCF
jgi:hypothetical protein